MAQHIEYNEYAQKTFLKVSLLIRDYGPTPELLLKKAYASLDYGELDTADQAAHEAFDMEPYGFVQEEVTFLLDEIAAAREARKEPV